MNLYTKTPLEEVWQSHKTLAECVAFFNGPHQEQLERWCKAATINWLKRRLPQIQMVDIEDGYQAAHQHLTKQVNNPRIAYEGFSSPGRFASFFGRTASNMVFLQHRKEKRAEERAKTLAANGTPRKKLKLRSDKLSLADAASLERFQDIFECLVSNLILERKPEQLSELRLRADERGTASYLPHGIHWPPTPNAPVKKSTRRTHFLKSKGRFIRVLEELLREDAVESFTVPDMAIQRKIFELIFAKKASKKEQNHV